MAIFQGGGGIKNKGISGAPQFQGFSGYGGHPVL